MIATRSLGGSRSRSSSEVGMLTSTALSGLIFSQR
jgi:hypothetical protein